MNHEEFVEKINEINPNLEILGHYSRRKGKILTRCKVCGYEWEPAGNSLLAGSDCLRCSYRKRGLARRVTQEQFEKKLYDINPDIKVLGEYKGNNEKILLKCMHCGHEWMAVPSSVLRGSHCPNCIAAGTSFMEMAIFYAFSSVLGDDAVKSRGKSVIGKELDIFIPDVKLAIEPGSWHWHEKKVNNDLQKQILCHEKGIRCITIYDSFTGDVVPFDDCWCYAENFSEPYNEPILRKAIEKLFLIANIQQEFSNEDWEQVKQLAHLSTCQMTTDELKEKVASIRPDIEILGEFTGVHHCIKVKCKKCGYVWDTTPSRMFQGRGCRKCGRKIVLKKLAMSQEDFESRLHDVNPNIEVLGRYYNNSKHIAVKCLKCGHEWMPTPSSLLNTGRGCPVCWEQRRGQSFVKSHDEFMNDFIEKGNPDIEILGEYNGSHQPIKVRCKKCGREWDSIPNTLLLGCGCIVCSGKAQKSNEQFLQELKLAHPELKALTPYKRADEKIKVHCNVCGNDFESRPVTLIRKDGTGCPVCGHKRAGQKNSRTLEQYKKEMNDINPDIEVLGDYVNANTPSLVRCKKCNYEWMVKPSYFLNMHRGCPNCRKKENSPAVVCVETGKVYENAKQAVDDIGLSYSETIYKCCKGKQKTAGGYHWKYVK